ncbi:MAG: hypothetical protein WCH58_00235 [Candidatus Saccharibacteria bacterium]
MSNEQYLISKQEDLESNSSAMIVVDATGESKRHSLVSYLKYEIFRFGNESDNDNQDEFVEQIFKQASKISQNYDNGFERRTTRDAGFDKAIELFKIADRLCVYYDSVMKLEPNQSSQSFNYYLMNQLFDKGYFPEAVNNKGKLKSFSDAVENDIMVTGNNVNSNNGEQKRKDMFSNFIIALSGIELRHYLDMPYVANDLDVEKKILNQKEPYFPAVFST